MPSAICIWHQFTQAAMLSSARLPVSWRPALWLIRWFSLLECVPGEGQGGGRGPQIHDNIAVLGTVRQGIC